LIEKVDGSAVAVGSGVIATGIMHLNIEYITLGSMGLLFGVLSFTYEATHNKEHKSTKEYFTELAMYALFGILAMPSGVAISAKYFTDISTQLLAGAMLSYSITKLIPAFIERAKRLIGDTK